MEYLHTMIRVGDVDAALDFFCKKLGMIEVRRTESEQGRFTLIFLATPYDEAKAPRRTGRRCSSSPTIGTRRAMAAGAISAISPIRSTTSTRPARASWMPA